MNEMNKKSDNTEADEKVICIYEAVFLNNDEILSLFNSIRSTVPYRYITKDFHVTTEFMPCEVHEQWYGEKVSVHITAYKAQEIIADDGTITENEGFKVSLSSENKLLQSYLDSLNNNFHITGSYKDGAKYTGQIDFKDGIKMNIETTGTFGCYESNGTFRLNV